MYCAVLRFVNCRSQAFSLCTGFTALVVASSRPEILTVPLIKDGSSFFLLLPVLTPVLLVIGIHRGLSAQGRDGIRFLNSLALVPPALAPGLVFPALCAM